MNKNPDLDLSTLLIAIDRMQSSFIVYDENFKLRYANAAARAAWPIMIENLEAGLSRYESIKAQVIDLYPQLDDEKLDAATQYTMQTQETEEARELKAAEGRAYRLHHEFADDRTIVSIGIDLSDLKRAQHQLKQLAQENFDLANRDELTGLANRRAFMAQISELIESEAVSESSFCLFLIDLDGFKLVNDHYGHPTGDELLQQVGARLATCFEQNASLARLGGDEFGVVLAGGHSRAALQALGEQVCAAMAAPFDLKKDRVTIAASVGWASFPDDGDSRSTLFERADFALYHAKGQGKGCAVSFSREHELAIRNNAALSLHLKEADLEREIHLAFQPIFASGSNLPICVEALARWTSPALGEISPAQFIPVAEQTAQMTRLTPVVLRKALHSAQAWPESIFLSINLSALDLASEEHARHLMDIIEQSPVSATRIVFEVTETAVVRDIDRVASVLALLRQTGARIALDDFGTGHSSLKYLAQMPLDILKIDRSFLQDIAEKDTTSAVFRSICDLGHSLKLICVAEGVETQAQYEEAVKAGVDLVQGYALSRPVKAEQILSALFSTRAANESVDYASSRKMGA